MSAPGYMIPPLCEDVESIYNRKKVVTLMASKVSEAKINEELDYSLNDLMLRGRVSAQAVEKEYRVATKSLSFDLLFPVSNVAV